MAKSKRKPNSGKRRKSRLYNPALMWAWESDVDPGDTRRNAYGMVRMAGVYVNLDYRGFRQVLDSPRLWTVCCRALIYHQASGKEWLEIEEGAAGERIPMRDMEEVYERMRKTVLENVKEAWVIDVGWIVTTVPDVFARYAQHELDNKTAEWYEVGLGDNTPERRELWLKNKHLTEIQA